MVLDLKKVEILQKKIQKYPQNFTKRCEACDKTCRKTNVAFFSFADASNIFIITFIMHKTGFTDQLLYHF